MSYKINYKISDYNKFTNGKTDNKLHIEFSGKHVNYVLMNTLRRIALEYIPMYSFDPKNIEIAKNTSVYNNDIIRIRLSVFPIYELSNSKELISKLTEIQKDEYKEDSFQQLTMHFAVKNNTQDIINVTTDDCSFYMGDKKIDSIYKTPLLIVKLKPGEEMNGSCRTSVGIGRQSAIYCPTQICCYEELDDNRFIFKIESDGQLDEKEILKRTCDVIIRKLNYVEEKLDDVELDDEIDIMLEDEDHTMGNLITYYIQDHKNVSYAGYKQDHLLQRKIHMYNRLFLFIHIASEYIYDETYNYLK